MQFILTLALTAIMAIAVGCQTASTKATNDAGDAKNAKPESNSKDLAKHSTDSAKKPDVVKHDDEDDVERITIEDAKKAVEKGEAIIVDARSKSAYENEHIEGSINIPTNEIEKRYKKLPKDKKIIVYCS